MKKVFSILTALIVTMTLVGCKSKEIIKEEITGIVTNKNMYLEIYDGTKLVSIKYKDNLDKIKVGDKITVSLNKLANEGNHIKTNKSDDHLVYESSAKNLYELIEIKNVISSEYLTKVLYYNGFYNNRDVFIDENGTNIYLDNNSYLTGFNKTKDFYFGEKVTVTYLSEESLEKDRLILRDVISVVDSHAKPSIGFNVVGFDKDGLIVMDGLNSTYYYVKGMEANIGDVILAEFKLTNEVTKVNFRGIPYDCQIISLENSKIVMEGVKNRVKYSGVIKSLDDNKIIVEVESKEYELIPETGFIFNTDNFKLNETIEFEGVISNREIKGVYYLRVN